MRIAIYSINVLGFYIFLMRTCVREIWSGDMLYCPGALLQPWNFGEFG